VLFKHPPAHGTQGEVNEARIGGFTISERRQIKSLPRGGGYRSERSWGLHSGPTKGVGGASSTRDIITLLPTK